MKETHSLYILKANIYKHQNDVITRYILVIISVLKKFRFSKKSWNFTKIQEISRKCMNILKIKLLKICLVFSFAMLVIKNFHPFHSISYLFWVKHLLHQNKFLHLQHNFVRQFKRRTCTFYTFTLNGRITKSAKKRWKIVQIIANALNALIVTHSNVFIDVLFLSHKQFKYVDLWS